jgi:P27 family predicted phage terminase small subunit
MNKPISQHKSDGTYRKDRHGKKNQAEPLTSMPKFPPNLPELCRDIWRIEMSNLVECRLIARKDVPAVAEMVRNIFLVQTTGELIERYGALIENDKGGLIRNPAFTTLEKAQCFILQYRKEFGLTSLSGQKLDKKVEVEEENEHDNLY